MQHYIMSVYDKQAQAFMQPFFTVNLDTASRAVSQVLQDPGHPFTCFPLDYSLVHLGFFDDNTGLITQPQGGFTTVAQIIQLMPRKQPQADLFQPAESTKEA